VSDRGFATALETALSADTVSLAILVFIDWPSDPMYTWSGVGSIEWNGQTWIGAGNLGHIDKVADSLQKNDTGVELTLNYLDDDLRNEVVTTDPRGSDASIYLALMNANGTVNEAYEVFPGFVDEVEIVDAGQTGSIKVRLASELARLAKPVYFQLSDAHQKFLFPGDRGMEFATRMDEPIYWGRKPSFVRTGGGGGGPGTRRR
jgi:hypothetical protein